MKANLVAKLMIGAAVVVSAAGCASWDSMSGRQKSTVVGAGVGGVAGAALTNGGILGTVGGAAIGGVVGDQIGKRR
ncbi:hypothetical protein CDO44_06450 [Pigmentiphaga sp. NML080357]|uniref:glycine zipper 2TM domain-containing protein n=1 Tax=Pigmentiphaga sp. NML080357 TaxID=2008675 RepID=UPI000B41533D|nr:glycine zipper 2TM domain-containing protein [Pigmentiphaga sp. NML080357]OVZ61273.1 hypothetical protein CDO44_06450 [Pigmentiphaga sp. NML080357]